MSFFTWIRQTGRKWNKTDWIVLILVGVLLMIIAIPTQNKPDDANEIQENNESNEQQDKVESQEYTEYLENKLEQLLGQMDGIGDVNVMITLQDDGTSIVDKDTSISEKENQQNTVIFSEDKDTIPFVTQTKYPGVEGVVVVAQGAGIPGISTDITECVMALFHVEAHKIKVLSMKK